MNQTLIFLLLCITTIASSQVPLTKKFATYQGGFQNDFSGSLSKIKGGGFYNAFSAGTGAFTSENAYQKSISGGTLDGMVQRMDSEGKILWSTYFGGESEEFLYASATDKYNNVVIVGETNSISNIAKNGYKNMYGGGLMDGFIASFDKDGQLNWSSYFGSNGTDVIVDVAADTLGNIYVTGYTNSTVGITLEDAFQKNYGGGNYDGFLAKFTNQGMLLWSTYIGGLNSDFGYTIAIDKNQNIWVGGTSYSISLIVTSNGMKRGYSGQGDGMLLTYNTNGEKIYGTYFGGSNLDEINVILPLDDGSLVIAGPTKSNFDIVTSNAFQKNNNGGIDLFIARIKDAKVLWSTYYGGTRWETIFGLTVGDQSQIYGCAMTQSALGIPIINAYQPMYGGGPWDACLFKLDTLGQVLWSTYYGGIGNDRGLDIFIDEQNRLVTAITVGSPNLHTPDAFDKTLGGDQDVLITIFEEKDMTTYSASHASNSVYKMYPNPTREVINIEGEFEYIELYNVTGQKMIKSQETKVDISHLPLGSYSIRVFPSGYVGKIVKL